MKFPMTADVFSTNHYSIVVGRMGQGKTSLVVSLFKTIWSKCYEHVYIVMPERSRNSIKDDIFSKRLNEDQSQIYDNLDEDVLDDIYAKLSANAEEEHNSIVIIDDFQSIYKDPEIALRLEKMIISIRHLRTTVILLQQNFVKIPLSLRNICQNFIMFNLGKSQLLRVFDEIVQQKKIKFDEIVDLAFSSPHDWILINLHKSKKIYKNFDEIIFLKE
jgi:hypothetical protein